MVSNRICTFAAKSKYMEKELFRAIIAENQEYIGRIPLVQRPIDIEEYGNYVFVGVRQAGKSYLLYQRIQQLLANCLFLISLDTFSIHKLNQWTVL